jgi:hypothetical protein
MDELLAFAAWLVIEIFLIQTGRLVVWAGTFGRWRGEAMAQNEGRIFSAAGSLTFLRDGRRVVTRNGLMIAGLVFYFALVASLIVYSSSN